MPTKCDMDSSESSLEIRRLRQKYYNAHVVSVIKLNDNLMILRVIPDAGPLEFEPGQYTVLGLGYWESRIAGTQMEDVTSRTHTRVVKRAYSISCRLVNAERQLVRANTETTLEFYVTLVRQAKTPPALTPRLFALRPGNRLYVGPKAHGNYVLGDVAADDTVIFAATGTGEAPHNAMLAELLARRHRGQIVSLTCVRYRKDLGYLPQHRILEKEFANYRYIPLTTRELENVDHSHPQFVGKRYLQDVFDSDQFGEETGCDLNPQSTHVYLCGSPDMIGVPRQTHDPTLRYPEPRGMVEVLEERGFKVDLPYEPGNIHFEKYW